jgi:polyferredoxin
MHGVTITWYAIAATALVVTGVAMQDQWYRYARIPRRRTRRTA